MHKYILYIIEGIRNSFDSSVETYTRGKCYKFYLILKSIFPSAIAYYNSDHVITRIRDKYYDITGEVKRTNHHSVDDHIDYSHETLNNI